MNSYKSQSHLIRACTTRLMLRVPVRCGLLVLSVLFLAIVAAAQPPPLGPPANRTEEGKLDVTVVTALVREKAQKMVDLTNAQLRADGKSYRVSIESVTTMGGSRSQTVSINKPNSWCVLLPYTVKIKVDIPHQFDRHIFAPVDIKFFCDGWHKGTGGAILVRAEPGPASIEGGSTLELFGLREYIDGQVRQNYTQPLQSAMALGIRCSTIGYSKKGTAAVSDDQVVWDVPKNFLIEPVGSIKPRILVTFDNLKRLRARGYPESRILYKEVEEINLRAFANYSEVGKGFLYMREGDEVALRLRTLDIDPEKFDKLVVIGSIEQPPSNPKDSSFVTAARSLKFSPGRHILQIPKWFSQIDQHTHKPLFYSVPAYELTYTVRLSEPSATP